MPAQAIDLSKIELGITASCWCNLDDPSIDLNPPSTYQQIMSEIALSGFKGTQMSGKFPQDIDLLKSELDLRSITISEPWVGVYFTIEDFVDSNQIFQREKQFMQQIGGSNSIVVAEMGGAVHQQPIDPLKNRPHFNDEQWENLAKGLNDIGKESYEAGMQLCYHPHVGTGVENLEDIDRLMELTDERYLKLLLDTGHLFYAGVDPLQVAKKYAHRIKHVHLKNIRQDVLEVCKQQGLSFLNAIKAGVFTVPGDSAGAVDFDSVLQHVLESGYEGWLVVEAEQDPNKANPLEYARIARHYLQDTFGL